MSRSSAAATPTPTPTANGSARPASRPSSSTPTTTCSRSTSVEDWKSEPWTLTPRDGRLYGRGAADDKGAITAQLGAVAAFLKTRRQAAGQRQDARRGRGGGRLAQPDRLLSRSTKKRIQSDVIVVCDTENIETGLPSITYSLRGIVAPGGRGAEAATCRSTAAWPAACWPTPPWP